MKLEPPENSNYAVTIVRVPDKLVDLPGLDKLKGFPVFGLQALVSADEFKPGELVAVLPTEVQLSDEFCKFNNLYRHAELNVDITQTGYLEDNRRVRAIKFRGNRSDALVVPLRAFGYTGGKFTDLAAGDTFDKLMIPASKRTLGAQETLEYMLRSCQCSARITLTDRLKTNSDSSATRVIEHGLEPTTPSMTGGSRIMSAVSEPLIKGAPITKSTALPGTKSIETDQSTKNDDEVLTSSVTSDSVQIPSTSQSGESRTGATFYPGTASQKRITGDFIKNKAAVVDCAVATSESSTSTMIIIQDVCAAYSVQPVTALSDNSAILKSLYNEHSNTCAVRNHLTLKGKTWVLDVPAGTYEICHKYVIKTKGTGKGNQPKTKKPSRVDARVFPEHIDTDNYWKNKHLISDDAWVYITQKVHGTSIRVGNVPVRRNLKLRDRVARKVGVPVTEHEHDYVYGSRKVVKDANNPDQNHFYGIWTAAGRQIQDVIPKGFVVYAELIGWTGPGGEAIQKHYTYKIPEGTNKLLVYRVAYVNPDGTQFDLSWPQMRAWTWSVGLDTVRLLWEGRHKDFDVDIFMDKRYSEYIDITDAQEYHWGNALPLEDDTKEHRKLVDEGVVVRADNGIRPTLLKAKSPLYLQKESEWLDAGEADLETVGSEEEANDSQL